jgi:hypothetical protein
VLTADRSEPETVLVPLPVVLTASVVPVVVGVLVVRRQRLIGVLLVAHGICFGLLTRSWTSATSHVRMVTDQLGAGSWVLLFVWLALIAYLLPTGRPSSVFWRRWVRVGLGGVVVFLVGAAGDTAVFRQAHHGAAPLVPWLPPGPWHRGHASDRPPVSPRTCANRGGRADVGRSACGTRRVPILR